MTRIQFHRKAYVVLLCLLAASMTTSVFATNLVWTLLLVNWVAEWNWKEKFADFKHNRLLQAFLVLLVVHLLWLIGTSNMEYALFDLQKKMPLVAVPLVVLTSRPLEYRERLNVGIAYVSAVMVVSIIGVVRYFTIPDLPYRDIVPYISHIRYGLNVCMTLALLAYAAFRHRRPWLYAINLLLSLWLCVVLVMLHAYTSFIILLIMPLVLLLGYGGRLAPKIRRWSIASYSVVIVALGVLVCRYVNDYFSLRPLSTEPLKACTENGNPYLHCRDGIIENGNYIHIYICEQEMRQQWAKISSYPIDSITPVGYPVYPALLRYLGGMGVTKDSAGMSHLTPADVDAIEKGIANPVYLQYGLRKMFYVLFYEYENYRCYHSVSNFSVLQRLDLWEAGWRVFLRHPLLGVGTGDVVDECHQQMHDSGSPLADTQLHTHNQYLNFLVAFGLLGFLAIAYFFISAIVIGLKKEKGNRKLAAPSSLYAPSGVLFVAFLCILLISFISEDTLETLAGIIFSVMGFTLLYPREARNNAS
ncbi:MAG: O-antigen ligase family protein [Bacteroidales bacterium]|nr:O-antigen ligase family protein [Bacteroidales bacterium]